MFTPLSWMPPSWLIRGALGGVWIYEGLWCKVLGKETRQQEVVEAVPKWGKEYGPIFLKALGWYEIALGLWVLSGFAPGWAALVQTLTLIALNANGLLWARHIIHDPGGMVVKNFALLVLAWVNSVVSA